jgi:hypothetical protein
MIAEAQKGMEGFEAGKFEEVGETMMEDMMQQFESMGDKDDYNEVSRIQKRTFFTVNKLIALFRSVSLTLQYELIRSAVH